MIFELVVVPSAARDIADADAHYAQFGKADAFLSAIDVVFEQLVSMPLMYPAVRSDVRRALLRRFPFSVFFLVEALGSSCSQFTTSDVIRRRGRGLKGSVARFRCEVDRYRRSRASIVSRTCWTLRPFPARIETSACRMPPRPRRA